MSDQVKQRGRGEVDRDDMKLEMQVEMKQTQNKSGNVKTAEVERKARDGQ